MTDIEFYQYLIHFVVMMTILVAMAIYLLVSKRNAFGRELVTDQRLRRKAGWAILISVFTYLANIPLVLWFADDPQLQQMASVTIDMVLYLPTMLCFMLETLQDRRRWDNRLWWFCVIAVLPLMGWLLTRQTWWTWAMYALYLTELATCIVWYIRAKITYHRFLADNYADLEHKDLTWSWIILCVMALSLVNYLLMMSQSDIHVIMAYSYVFHVADTIFIGIIVLYIDHQQVLEPLAEETLEAEMQEETEVESGGTENTPIAPISKNDIIIIKIGALLLKHCEATQLYLQHDLSLNTVAQACHTNRTYLSLYFASQGITYYTYINKLRIDYFQSLYRKALREKITPPTLQQLSTDSGFSSYNTFSRAFVSCKGVSVSKWLAQVSMEE